MHTTATPLQPNSSVKRTVNKELSSKRNEQSLDYVLKSGIAGGIAGCVVTYFLSLLFSLVYYILIVFFFLGKNCHCSS